MKGEGPRMACLPWKFREWCCSCYDKIQGMTTVAGGLGGVEVKELRA